MDSNGRPKRVCVIGAGLSGLAALKQCLEDDIEPVCFEKSDRVGGQWAYDPNVHPEVHSSMYAGCVLNSCRDTSAFPDFPLDPSRYPDYFGHAQFCEYFNEYADHFGLRPYIRFRTQVIRCVPIEDGPMETKDDRGSAGTVNGKGDEAGGSVASKGDGAHAAKEDVASSLDGKARGVNGWRLTIQEEGSSATQEVDFDAIFACSGNSVKPVIPAFKDRDVFSGEFLHSHYYRTPGPYEGKKVALIGMGSSAIDIACEVAPQAKEFHHITRRGVWVLPRFLLGRPLEAWDDRATQSLLPHSIAQFLQTKLLNAIHGKPPPSLAPEHKLLEQNASLRSDFFEKVNLGIITPHKSAIESFTPHGMVLSNGETLADVDVVICATGYEIAWLPFLPADAIPSRDPEYPPPHVDLYKLCVSPYYENLYVIGQLELLGPLAPAVEAQVRYTTALLSGKVPRPSKEAMLKGIKEFRQWQGRMFIQSERHILTAGWMNYIDSLLEPLRANPTIGRVLFEGGYGVNPLTRLQLLLGVYFGVVGSAQFRLFGIGKKPELAKATVLRIAAGKKTLSENEVKSLSGEVPLTDVAAV